jgi:hypothetical protein
MILFAEKSLASWRHVVAVYIEVPAMQASGPTLSWQAYKVQIERPWMLRQAAVLVMHSATLLGVAEVVFLAKSDRGQGALVHPNVKALPGLASTFARLGIAWRVGDEFQVNADCAPATVARLPDAGESFGGADR